MNRDDVVRTAGLVVDFLTAMGLEDGHIREVAQTMPDHLMVRDHYEAEAPARTVGMEPNWN